MDDLLTPGEVAVLFKVNPKTVHRWCMQNRVEYIKTPGGHLRIKSASIKKLLEGA